MSESQSLCVLWVTFHACVALLWDYELPFAGLATPATYMVDGKQFVVIAAGGGKDPKHALGGRYVAFALR